LRIAPRTLSFVADTKLPKPLILIFSPRPRVSFIISKTKSTTSADSFLEKPPIAYTAWTISAFVMIVSTPCDTYLTLRFDAAKAGSYLGT